MAGRLLQNRYELLEKIAEGGMSTVYKAHCTLLDRIVAVKILKDEYSQDSAFVAKFRSEAQTAARVSHPNIVNIYDVGEDNGSNFIVMEYMDGTTLKELIDKKGPLPPDEVIRIALMICDALEAAHSKGLIHRDIKPHNILITPDGTAKVADFGIARASSAVTITHSGNMVGSVHYVSPEQARGEPVDQTTDIYSLGCVMYEMITGRVPFEADSPVTVALKHIHENPKMPSILNEAVTRDLERIILTAMEKNPTYRFQSAADMKNALRDVLIGKGKSSYKKHRNDRTIIMPPVGRGEDLEMTRKRKKITPMGYMFIAAAILGLCLGVVYAMRGTLFGQEVTVPNVVGATESEATTMLDNQGLKIRTINRMHSSEVEKDCIISQDPAADEKVKKGREIEVVISLGAETVEVPGLIDETLEDARTILKNQGLLLGRITRVADPDVPSGTIISQDPEEGEKANEGDRVDVSVSKGKDESEDKVKIPDLVGMQVEDARASIESEGLVLSRIDKEYSEAYFIGQVTKQSLVSGQNVDKGTEISLTISSGPGPSPKTTWVEYTMPPKPDYSVLSVVQVDSKGRKEIYNNTHLGGYTFSQQVEYYGKGTVTFYVDGEAVARQELQ